MVLFLLYMKAELENVESVTLQLGGDRPSNNSASSPLLCFDVKNPLSDYEVREKIMVDPTETVEEDNSKSAPVHFSMKWEGSKKPSVLTVLTTAQVQTALKKSKNKQLSKSTLQYTDSGSLAPILAVECRGLEPTAFYPTADLFVVQATGGAIFVEDVDFSEGDWADYDADQDQPVSISDIEFQWKAV